MISEECFDIRVRTRILAKLMLPIQTEILKERDHIESNNFNQKGTSIGYT